MTWSHDDAALFARRLTVVVGVLVYLAAASPMRVLGAEPSTAPVLRIEPEMHAAAVARLAIDASARFLVSGSEDKTVRVWALGTGRLLQTLRPPIGAGAEGRIFSVAISPDGATIAAGGWTGYEWDQSNAIYFFDRATGRLTRRISGLAKMPNHLSWSADGALLAAALGGTEGIRVFRVRDGAEVGSDRQYSDSSTSVEFHRSDKLLSSALDGALRVYQVSERGLVLLRRAAAGPAKPLFARFSPDGARLAVTFAEIPRVDVMASDTLAFLHSAETRDMQIGDFSTVAWSADGSQLYAAGRHARGSSLLIRAWTQGGRGPFRDFVAGSDTIRDLVTLPGGGIVYGATDGSLGRFDQAGRKAWERLPSIAHFRPLREPLRVSHDGFVVDFGFGPAEKSAGRISLRERRLILDPLPADTSLAAPVTTAPGLDLRDWLLRFTPTLNGRVLPLDPYEASVSVAVAPDRHSFVLGTVWTVRKFDAQGRQFGWVPAPGTAWSVNVSGDGKLFIAAYGDGTIRWYRMSDGVEVLAFFPHADRKRWVMWTPSGYYDASPGAEDLIGWHLNRGKDVASDFFPASRFRGTFYRPDVLAKALETLDEAAAVKVANEDAGRKAQPAAIAKSLPPVVQILAPADDAAVSTPEVRVRFALRTAPDAPIVAVRARVNGQAVALGDARNLGVGATSDTTREIAIRIPPQDSDVMLFAENRHGVSTPAVVHVTWRGAQPSVPASTPAADFVTKPKLYVVAVGVSAYRDPAMQLRFAAKDAHDFAQAMRRQQGGLYRDVEMKILTDAQANKDEVLDALDWLRKEVTHKDIGMLFLAGHGVNDANGIYYYLPSNADTDKLMRTGVPFSDIKNTLSSLAGKALFFIDTCHSGNVMGTRRSGPVDITGVVNELTSAENGVVVFASSTGRQYSLESAEWNNGAFTKALVEGLTGQAAVGQTGRITHKMLDLYVAERVKTLTKGQQTPVNTTARGVPDFPIALTTN